MEVDNFLELWEVQARLDLHIEKEKSPTSPHFKILAMIDAYRELKKSHKFTIMEELEKLKREDDFNSGCA